MRKIYESALLFREIVLDFCVKHFVILLFSCFANRFVSLVVKQNDARQANRPLVSLVSLVSLFRKTEINGRVENPDVADYHGKGGYNLFQNIWKIQNKRPRSYR